MRTTRVYYPDRIQLHSSLWLDEQTSRHVGLVLRLSAGEEIIVFNGDGFDYVGKIRACSAKSKSKQLEIEMIEKRSLQTESALYIHLVQAVSRPEKLEWVIQKSTELGVSEISLIMTEYCSVKFSAQKKSDRYQKIMISACEQSGRATLVNINPVKTFSDYLRDHPAQWGHTVGIICEPESEHPLKNIQHKHNAFTVLIGPEGGFSPTEIKLAQEKGFQSVRFGHRILRTETAGVCAITALQTLWGDFY